jgi:hypothetical protein
LPFVKKGGIFMILHLEGNRYMTLSCLKIDVNVVCKKRRDFTLFRCMIPPNTKDLKDRHKEPLPPLPSFVVYVCLGS